MIHVSSSLVKSGSSWYYQLANRLCVRAGLEDARDVRERHGLHDLLRDDNCRLNPTARRLARLVPITLRGESFTVKSHAGPRPALLALAAAGVARVSYVSRDPRDVVVSALDHGRRIRDEKPAHRLARLESPEEAARFVARELRRGWAGWRRSRLALMVRYEDVVADPRAELHRLAAYLGLDVTADDIDATVRAFEPDRASAWELDAMKFNKARIGRWRDVLSADEVAACHAAFGRYLGPMGYE